MDYFERPASGERALLVHTHLTGRAQAVSVVEDESEFRELARAAGVLMLDYVRTSRPRPDPRYYLGHGKVEELRQRVEQEQVEVLLVDNTLTPAQERNLESALHCRVIDRTGLILDIFAQRARSYEGQLQVELAQLEHLATRLVRGWTHLERQKGGIGLRGPGETQLETDRRLLRQRVALLKQRLADVRRTRALGRSARLRSATPAVALVGYTNAGKSTLFNRLSAAHAFTADQLFATLDPMLRRIELATIGTVVLVDTVGFIRQLPHTLVDAFQATLEETLQADLLLHVVDASNPERDRQRAAVAEVLQEVGAGTLPCLEVFNKIDRLEAVEPHAEVNAEGVTERVWVSVLHDQGIETLLQAIATRLGASVPLRLRLLPAFAGLRARLFAHKVVLQESVGVAGEFLLRIQMQAEALERLLLAEGLQLADVLDTAPEDNGSWISAGNAL